MQTKVYKPISSIKISSLLGEMLEDAKRSRDLAWRLTVRDIKGQYRQSILGFFWAFFIPLMNAVAWIFLQASGVVKISNTGIPYPAYVFTGTILWSILVESINAPLAQTQAAKGIMGKINFPKEALLISGIYKILYNTFIKSILLVLVLLSFGILPSFSVLFFPVGLCAIITVGFLTGMLLTPIGMLYKDIGHAIPLLMQFLMFLSPVVYSVGGRGVVSEIIRLNPLTPLIVNTRNALTGQAFDNLVYFAVVVGGAILLLMIGWLFYRISIPIIIEKSS